MPSALPNSSWNSAAAPKAMIRTGKNAGPPRRTPTLEREVASSSRSSQVTVCTVRTQARNVVGSADDWRLLLREETGLVGEHHCLDPDRKSTRLNSSH